LDAETGGQKSALETADVHRDGKSRDDTGEIPAETASLEADEMRVWEDWMVVCAVRYEPVSKDNSLLTGKLTGYFAILGPLEATSRRKAAVPQRLLTKFPKKNNREKFSNNRDRNPNNRLLRLDNRAHVF
jgi:hypothetical protein